LSLCDVLLPTSGEKDDDKSSKPARKLVEVVQKAKVEAAGEKFLERAKANLSTIS
jgi:hypothetical protein